MNFAGRGRRFMLSLPQTSCEEKSVVFKNKSLVVEQAPPVSIRLQMRSFSVTGESLIQTKETKMDQCERVRVN